MAGVLRQPLLSPAAAPFSLFTQSGLRRTAFSCGACRIAVRQQPSIPQQQPQKQQRRNASGHRRNQRRGDMAPSVGMSQQKGTLPSVMISFRLPQTYVPPDLGPYLSKPTVFFKLLWLRQRVRLTDFLAELSVRVQSKTGFFKAARYKPNKKAIVPTAKSMHYQMLEATAAGDTATLRRLLTQHHLDEVSSLLARRPRGQRCDWELLSYKGTPQIVDNKVLMVPGPVPFFIRQVVVAIRSRQRFTWTNDNASGGSSNIRRKTTAAGPSSGPAPTVVEKDVKENIVLVASLDRSTWQSAEWRIFGFLPESTLESWEAEKQLIKASS